MRRFLVFQSLLSGGSRDDDPHDDDETADSTENGGQDRAALVEHLAIRHLFIGPDFVADLVGADGEFLVVPVLFARGRDG